MSSGVGPPAQSKDVAQKRLCSTAGLPLHVSQLSATTRTDPSSDRTYASEKAPLAEIEKSLSRAQPIPSLVLHESMEDNIISLPCWQFPETPRSAPRRLHHSIMAQMDGLIYSLLGTRLECDLFAPSFAESYCEIMGVSTFQVLVLLLWYSVPPLVRHGRHRGHFFFSFSVWLIYLSISCGRWTPLTYVFEEAIN